jgi:pyruvate/2-oxoglutarate dehydrogenase complex dihydrolipoamide dehydrogenase (E3) component
MSSDYQVAVIGSGSGGREATLLAARNGLPPVATVGWTQREAAAEGFDCLVASDDIRLVSDDERSFIDPEPTFVKIIVDAGTRHLLGCLVVGDHASVIVNIATIAMRSGLSVDKFRQIPLSQPAASEALMSTLRKLG